MSTKPKVLVTRLLPPDVEARLKRDYDVTLNPTDQLYDTETLLAKAEGADALLILPSESMSAEVISRLPESVKVVATFSVGFEHIDCDAAKQRGIAFGNTPEVLNDCTADIAMMLLLATARRAHECETILRGGGWTGMAPTWMLGTKVTGQRLGIVGMGRIGQAMAKRARGFDMEIHYHNRTRLPAALEQGATYHADASQMLPLVTFLSMHCPLSPETRHWLNAERIARLPDGAIVINTARGPVIDEAALIAALQSGKLGGAGLDVFEREPQVPAELTAMRNVFLMPHMGSATLETRNAMGFKCCDNIDAYFAGRELPSRIA